MTFTNKSQGTLLILLQLIFLTQPSLPAYARSLGKQNQEIWDSSGLSLESVFFYILRNMSEFFKVPQGHLIPQIFLLFSGQAVVCPIWNYASGSCNLKQLALVVLLKKKKKSVKLLIIKATEELEKRCGKEQGNFNCKGIHCFTKIQQFFLNKYFSGYDKPLVIFNRSVKVNFEIFCQCSNFLVREVVFWTISVILEVPLTFLN